MNIDTALINTRIEAEQIAAEHLDYIKSGGEESCSAMLRMAMFEMTKEGEADRSPLLATEYVILKALTQAMEDEIKRRVNKEEQQNGTLQS